MDHAIRYEQKIVSNNIFWISAAFVVILSVLAYIAGDLINIGYLCFEVIFPFFAVIGVCEWCKTRSSPMFDIISAQSKSIFRWTLRRYVYVFGIISAFAIVGMAIFIIIVPTLVFAELLL